MNMDEQDIQDKGGCLRPLCREPYRPCRRRDSTLLSFKAKLSMNPLETYVSELHSIRSTGTGVKETSYYPALNTLLNTIGKTLKPTVRCIINLKNQGAGIPDGGSFSANPLAQKTGHAICSVEKYHYKPPRDWP